MGYLISGIQQVGIGVPDVRRAFRWYNSTFGMDIPVFEEAAEAALMLPYTAGKPQSRHAILAINLRGGGGFEIWQYTSRTPQPAAQPPQLGDLGIFAARMKCDDVPAMHAELRRKKDTVVGEIATDPRGRQHFFVRDPFGNHFDVVEFGDWFSKNSRHTGGPVGALIGVSDLERSIAFYRDVLGYDQVTRFDENVFADLSALPGGSRKLKRAVLSHTGERKGPFSALLGKSELELVQAVDTPVRKIFEGRFWGDLGFIHLCFDIRNMSALRSHCEKLGHPFTVDGGAGFEMGEAAGHFTYIEDPDGTLVEFVETFKIPILKKLGWYLDLRKRDPEKRLPRWMLLAMRLNRRKPGS